MGELHSEKVLRSMSLISMSGKFCRMQAEMLKPGHIILIHEAKTKKFLCFFPFLLSYFLIVDVQCCVIFQCTAK